MPGTAALPGLAVAGSLSGGALLAPGLASPLALARVAGALLTHPRPLPPALAPGMRVAASGVMPIGVVLLGLSVTAEAVRSLGWGVLLLVLTTVAAALRSWFLLAGGTLLGVLDITAGQGEL